MPAIFLLQVALPSPPPPPPIHSINSAEMAHLALSQAVTPCFLLYCQAVNFGPGNHILGAVPQAVHAHCSDIGAALMQEAAARAGDPALSEGSRQLPSPALAGRCRQTCPCSGFARGEHARSEGATRGTEIPFATWCEKPAPALPFLPSLLLLLLSPRPPRHPSRLSRLTESGDAGMSLRPMTEEFLRRFSASSASEPD